MITPPTFEETLDEAGAQYGLKIVDVVPGFYSRMQIVNGKTTTIECRDLPEAVRLEIDLRRRRMHGDVSKRWGGRHVPVEDVVHYLGRDSAFTGRAVVIPPGNVTVFTDTDDYNAFNFADGYIRAGGRREAFAGFSSSHKKAPDEVVYFCDGIIYDSFGDEIGSYDGTPLVLGGLEVRKVTGEEIAKAKQDPHFLREATKGRFPPLEALCK